MNNENYIVINGKKTKLTEEQLKRLGIEVKPKRNNPFCRTERHDDVYYSIDVSDAIICDTDGRFYEDNDLFACANYFNNKDFANQVMLHQQLYRKLLKYAYDNNAEVTEEDWEKDTYKYYIYHGANSPKFFIDWVRFTSNLNTVYFKDKNTAINAIRDIIEPFMKKHPEFVW